MKKILSLLAILIAVNFSYAQTNTLPSSGNVGIGTTSPLSPLTVGSNTSNMQSTTGITLGVGQNNVEFLNSTYGSGFGAKIYGVDSGSGVTTLRIATRGNSTTWNDAFTVNASASGNGNVGIGTTSPSTTLDVNGATTTTPTIINRNTSYSSTDATGTVALGLYFANHGAAKIEASKSATNITDLNFYGEYGFNTASPIMTLQPTSTTGGNVGIGTTSPANTLQIGSVGTSGYGGNAIAAGDGTNVIAMHYGTTGYLVANGNLALGGGTNTSSQLFLESGGNVGIGTTDPKGYKLAVNGSMIATSIKVKPYANWPDYVFKPQYHLPSLAEVKKYIDQNQHLPDMPSEQEVAKDGIDLGGIVKIQTKKIEELTLYLIEKDKEVKEIKDQKANQQKQIDELKSQVEQLLKHK